LEVALATEWDARPGQCRRLVTLRAAGDGVRLRLARVIDDPAALERVSGWHGHPQSPRRYATAGGPHRLERHIGIVEFALPDARIQTVEGNSSDKVSQSIRNATGDGAIRYVRLG